MCYIFQLLFPLVEYSANEELNSDDHYPSHSMVQTTMHDFFYEDNEIDGFEFEIEDDKYDGLHEDEQVDMIQ